MRWMVVLLALGCDDGGDDHGGHGGSGGNAPPAGDTYVAGMEKVGAAGALQVRLKEARPGPPEIGDNTWILEVLDMQGESMPGCTVEVDPRMPAHGHGTNKEATITETAGTYEVTPLDLFMPGLWEVPFTVTCGAVVDDVMFEFWIEG